MSAVRKRLYYLWKKFSEKQSRKRFETDNNKIDIERFAKCTEKKPAAQIRREMKILQQYWDCYPFQYYRYDFYRRDCPLSVEEMKTYVPHFFIMNLFFPHSYKEYGVLCEDKLLTNATLKAYNLRQPKLLFCYDHNRIFDQANTPLSASGLQELLHQSQAKKLFVKPRFGLGGNGIQVFTKNEHHNYVHEDGTDLNAAFFQRFPKEFFIVQEGLAQHEELKKIYPGAINTFRVMTECVGTTVRVLYALLRMGSGGQEIDNASSGGLYIRLDPETGRLGEAAFAFNRLRFAQHPDTGFVFNGAAISVWPEAKQFTIDVAKKFREIRYMGWDIAMTPDGPAVIELNNAPGISIIQDCYGGIRDDLNITPKDWWYRSNYTIKNL